MQEFFTIFLPSITQGILEFLPVSSSAHFSILAKWIGIINIEEAKFFAELASFLCILFYFRSLIIGHLLSPLQSIHFFGKILISCLPCVVAFPILKNFMGSISLFLILGSILMIIAEYIYKKKSSCISDINSVTYKQAFIVGVFQIFAIFSGFSRSGSTISGGLISGLSRNLAVKFSFLISLPLTFASLVYDFVRIKPTFNLESSGIFILTLLASAVAIKPCLKLLSKISLNWFAGYRILLALFLIFLMQ